jgi:hypothetical protein
MGVEAVCRRRERGLGRNLVIQHKLPILVDGRRLGVHLYRHRTLARRVLPLRRPVPRSPPASKTYPPPLREIWSKRARHEQHSPVDWSQRLYHCAAASAMEWWRGYRECASRRTPFSLTVEAGEMTSLFMSFSSSVCLSFLNFLFSDKSFCSKIFSLFGRRIRETSLSGTD